MKNLSKHLPLRVLTSNLKLLLGKSESGTQDRDVSFIENDHDSMLVQPDEEIQFISEKIQIEQALIDEILNNQDANAMDQNSIKSRAERNAGNLFLRDFMKIIK
jgi:hypothetical protein